MNAHQVLSGLRRITSDVEVSDVTVTTLPGGASFRTYHRIQHDNRSWVLMVMAEEPIRSEEATSGPTPDEIPFVEIGQYLAEGGVPVPKIHHIDRENGHLWLDDLGDTHLLSWLEQGGDHDEGYAAAIETLVSFQAATTLTASTPLSDTKMPICYARSFEPALLRWELEHWIEWRVEAQLETTLSAADRDIFNTSFDALVAAISKQPTRLVHRDFQSTNLMVTSSTPTLALIDFQDALMGSWTYDLVALLRDSYVDLSRSAVDGFIAQYTDRLLHTGLVTLDQSAQSTASVRRTFERDFHRQVLQRKLKDAGRFVYIDRVKQNPGYLQYVDRTMRFVRESLEWLERDGTTPHIGQLSTALRRVDPESFA